MVGGHTKMKAAQGEESARLIRNIHKVTRVPILTWAYRLVRRA